ncbi:MULTISPECIES: hypothetical protein [unclassified Acinetobacter]|uniref:hypothetical protein n=1 Tax=unclassified Acinetobacter TaxID=196816 RepID=UPI0015D1F39F|nr:MULTISPECIES: hypothetical protein [unclassified Acinetobacter]
MTLWIIIIFLLLVVTYHKVDKAEKLSKHLVDRISNLEEENTRLTTDLELIKETKASKEAIKSISEALEKKAPLDSLEQTQRLVKELEQKVFEGDTVDSFIDRNRRIYGAALDD